MSKRLDENPTSPWCQVCGTVCMLKHIPHRGHAAGSEYDPCASQDERRQWESDPEVIKMVAENRAIIRTGIESARNLSTLQGLYMAVFQKDPPHMINQPLSTIQRDAAAFAQRLLAQPVQSLNPQYMDRSSPSYSPVMQDSHLKKPTTSVTRHGPDPRRHQSQPKFIRYPYSRQ
jgi:hypothetical protein